MCRERAMRGISRFVCFIPCLSLCSVEFGFCSIFQLSHISVGMKGSWGGAPPSSRLARRRRGFLGSVIL